MKYLYLIFFSALLGLALSFTNNSEDSESESEEGKVYSSDGSLLSCGVERWSIKTCIDADTTHVNFGLILPSTIAYQRSLPVQPSLPPNNRLPLEDTVFQIDCRLARFKLEADGDVHCVIVSGTDSMVSEICDPTCPGISTTSRYGQLLALRSWFVGTYNPTSSWQYPNVMVRITGVGFYDFLHGQIGIPPNGREIHPILTMSLITGQDPLSNEIPAGFKLNQNFPNPFNPSTVINYELPKISSVSLIIYDLGGKEISRLINGDVKQAGRYSIQFNSANLASGVYFYRLTADNYSESRKMLLVK